MPQEVPIKDRIDSIPCEKILEPNISIAVYLQEAYNIYLYAQADKKMLCSRGLDWAVVEELPRRIDYLREAEGRCYVVRYSETPSEKACRELFAKTDEARRQLLVDLEYAAGIDGEQALVRNIKHGNSKADYIQDLSDMRVAAEARRDRLDEIGADPKLVEIIGNAVKPLSVLVAQCEVERSSAKRVTRDRDKAYTFLVVAVEAIRRAAHLAFWNDRKRLRGYASEYFRKSTRKRRKEKSAP